jgi:hypothetical protein
MDVGQAWHDVWHDIFYDVFIARCISMHMSLNETEHMYTITARLHRWFIRIFILDVPICLWVSMEQSICI